MQALVPRLSSGRLLRLSYFSQSIELSGETLPQGVAGEMETAGMLNMNCHRSIAM